MGIILLNFKLSILCLLLISCSAQARRYKVPLDREVMQTISVVNSPVQIYPLSVKVLVWNIYKGENKSWEDEFLTLSQDKDLLLLQEVVLNKKMTRVLENSDYGYLFATSWIDSKQSNLASGVATGSRSNVEHSLWQRSYYREPFIRTPKMTLFTAYKVAGTDEKLLVGNIHAINFVRTYKLKHMLKEAAKVIKSHKGPVIFGGDFNTWSKRKIRNMNTIFKNLGMKSVKFKNDTRKRFFGRILDHVWLRGIEVQSAIVPRSNGSDHAPMELELGIY